MRPRPSTPFLMLVILIAALGCGERAAADRVPAKLEDQGPPVPNACLTEEEVGKAIGMAVRSTGQRQAPCLYQIDGYAGASVELRVAPDNLAEITFESIRSHAKGALGSSAEADRIDVGEGGWAFGSNSNSEAAAVAQGWVYHAQMTYAGDLGHSIGNKKDAMVRLVAGMID